MKKCIGKDITQSFYDNLAAQYDKLFLDWQATTGEQARLLAGIFCEQGFDKGARILDCACGIGTQAIGLAALGYDITGSDVSRGELAEARSRAASRNVNIHFQQADFCALAETFTKKFDIVIAMDNALPHMLTADDLARAVQSIVGQLADGGIFVASIRDYDRLLLEKPAYSPPYIHTTDKGRRISFQTWDWQGDNYKFAQYIIDDQGDLQADKFECKYRAVRRQELTDLLLGCGCRDVSWQMPEESGFYQPIVIARK